MPRIPKTLIAALAALILAAPGCTEQGGGSASSAPAGRPPANGPVKVPADARRIAEGTGATRLIHRPLRDGTIYVQDKSDGKVIYTGPVRAGDNVVIDPKADALTVNDIQVRPDPKLNSGHAYRLYFVQK
jgi:hypothetical protein